MSSPLQSFHLFWVSLVSGSVPVYLHRYQRWLPVLISLRSSSWCLWAKRNQWRCKEPRVSRFQRFSLPHSFPCGAVKLSPISIQTALLIASFEKMEQSGHFPGYSTIDDSERGPCCSARLGSLSLFCLPPFTSFYGLWNWLCDSKSNFSTHNGKFIRLQG